MKIENKFKKILPIREGNRSGGIRTDGTIVKPNIKPSPLIPKEKIDKK